GDGTSIEGLFSIFVTVTHEYTTYGQYIITLEVRDSEGLNDTVPKTVVVRAPPLANFTCSPEQPDAYELITFDASTSKANGGTISSYVWDFGDGNTTTATNPVITHYYTEGGNYSVTLNVTDSEGLSDLTFKTITVTSPTAPQARFAYSPPSPHVFETIFFNASESTPGMGMIIEYEWNFGDGNVTTVSEPTITHAYQAAGNFTVTLKIMDSIEQASTTSKVITILPISGPTANFTWSPEFPQVNTTLTLNASTSTPGWNGTIYPQIVSYTWNFGDGNVTTVSEPIITHVYWEQGNYTVTLTVTDINGANGMYTQTIEVRQTPPYDINGDGKVDIKDVAIVSQAYGSYPGDPNWNPAADINNDGKVDIKDVAIVSSHYGEEV
ncbi:PKD domain-containing protein, partial [Candidatus Bathyarchaeota archaeon]|nr:PKD domain-containing protein [Candidatus Bathyarchaeota archaeon]